MILGFRLQLANARHAFFEGKFSPKAFRVYTIYFFEACEKWIDGRLLKWLLTGNWRKLVSIDGSSGLNSRLVILNMLELWLISCKLWLLLYNGRLDLIYGQSG